MHEKEKERKDFIWSLTNKIILFQPQLILDTPGLVQGSITQKIHYTSHWKKDNENSWKDFATNTRLENSPPPGSFLLKMAIQCSQLQTCN